MPSVIYYEETEFDRVKCQSDADKHYIKRFFQDADNTYKRSPWSFKQKEVNCSPAVNHMLLVETS